MNQSPIIKTLWGIKGNALGEVFSTPEGNFGFFHFDTQAEKLGFVCSDMAYDELVVVHTDYLENL